LDLIVAHVEVVAVVAVAVVAVHFA
jgi:hypothetical protein